MELQKRSLPEQCRYWETELLKVGEQLRSDNKQERTVVVAVALFLGDLADQLDQLEP